MKKLSTTLFIAALLGLGCTHKFDKINMNPNQPVTVTDPGLLLPNVIRGSFNKNMTNAFDRGCVAADLLAEGYASNFNNWVRADASNYFCWDFYDYIRDLNDMITISDDRGMKNYEGIALVLRSWMFQCLTDLYGPIPFREASNAALKDIGKPKYEKQEDVYKGILDDLEQANQLLGSSSENISGDILYGGDIARWKEFADGLMLRILLRESNRVDPSQQMQEIVGHPDKYPLFSSSDDEAALQYIADRLDNESPFYRGSNSDYANSTRISESFISELKSINDPRLYVYALPTPNSSNAGHPEYVGTVNGHGDILNPNQYSPPGMLWAPLQYSPQFASPNAAQSVVLSYAEVQFTLAEAAERGFIPGGSSAAEAYYLSGIKDQFKYWSGRIPDNYVFPTANDVIPDPSYYNQPGVAYLGNTQEKLHKIWLQKRIALYMCGYEAWSEWRRTGYPTIQVGPQGPGYIVRRCLYPADEMRINIANYNEAVGWLGADDLKTHVWWDNK
jgi:hypothetical protein